MPAAPTPLILIFWCLQLVIAELILCDKAVPAANEFLFLAWGQLSFSSILQGRIVSWWPQIIWPILNMTKCSLLEWLFPTERVLCQVESEGNNAMKSLVYSWSFFSVLDSDPSTTHWWAVVHRRVIKYIPREPFWVDFHDIWCTPLCDSEAGVHFPFLKSGNQAAAERLDSELKPGCTF